VGRLPEARAEIARAVQADPTSPIIQVVAGAAEMRSLNFDAALAQYQRALELDPSFDQARWLTIAALVLKGEPAKARKVLDEVRTKADADRLLETAWLDAVEGRRERALAVLRELDGRIQPDETAKVWLALGDRDRAMAQLERGCAERASGVLGVKTAPFLRPLQTHPRWPELMKCLHLD
jgi:tetratricopeptide (TPR) repeat protein